MGIDRGSVALPPYREQPPWLGNMGCIETGRHQGIARQDRTCQMCNDRVLNPGLPAAQFDSFDSDEDADDPIEDEHHVIFACSGYVYARQLFPDLFSETTSTVGHFLSQPNPNRVAKFLTWITNSMRLNRAQSDGSASGPEQTLNQIFEY